MNKHKQFIKDCYNGKYGTMCNEWKQTILNHYPEFEETLKVGKWYKANYESKYLIYAEELYDKTVTKGYGFYDMGEWFDFPESCSLYLTVPATEEEVKTALIKEAKKRGYHKNYRNVKCLCGWSELNDIVYYDKNDVYFDYEENNSLWMKGKSNYS